MKAKAQACSVLLKNCLARFNPDNVSSSNAKQASSAMKKKHFLKYIRYVNEQFPDREAELISDEDEDSSDEEEQDFYGFGEGSAAALHSQSMRDDFLNIFVDKSKTKVDRQKVEKIVSANKFHEFFDTLQSDCIHLYRIVMHDQDEVPELKLEVEGKRIAVQKHADNSRSSSFSSLPSKNDERNGPAMIIEPPGDGSPMSPIEMEEDAEEDEDQVEVGEEVKGEEASPISGQPPSMAKSPVKLESGSSSSPSSASDDNSDEDEVDKILAGPNRRESATGSAKSKRRRVSLKLRTQPETQISDSDSDSDIESQSSSSESSEDNDPDNSVVKVIEKNNNALNKYRAADTRSDPLEDIGLESDIEAVAAEVRKGLKNASPLADGLSIRVDSSSSSDSDEDDNEGIESSDGGDDHAPVSESQEIRNDMKDPELLSGRKRKRAVFWTEEEVKALNRLVPRYFAKGKKWKEILEEDRSGAKIFHESRTPVKLKEKYAQLHGHSYTKQFLKPPYTENSTGDSSSEDSSSSNSGDGSSSSYSDSDSD